MKLSLEIILKIDDECFGASMDLNKMVRDGKLEWNDVKYASEDLLVMVGETLEEALKDSQIKFINHA